MKAKPLNDLTVPLDTRKTGLSTGNFPPFLRLTRIAIVWLCLLLGFAPRSATADTFVPTTINTSTWAKSGNNYLIAADATVPSGQVLTIQPGVQVILAPGVELNVQGRILAVGSPSEHIIFRGAGENYWNRVFVQDNGNGLSRFLWCNFSSSTNALYLYIYGRNATMATEISNCTFTRFTDAAIYARAQGRGVRGASYSPTISPVIRNCLIETGSNSSGSPAGVTINIYGQRGSVSFNGALAYARPMLLNNIIRDVDGPAFVFVNGPVSGGPSDAAIINNTVSRVAKGIVTASPFDILAMNNIFANCTNGIERLDTSPSNLNVRYNCFFNNDADFVNYPAAYSSVIWQNANGDDADINFNIFEDPQFADTNTFALGANSRCIDAGDPSDPAYGDICFAISKGTSVADLGAYGGADACNWLDVVPLIAASPWMTLVNSHPTINWAAIPRATYRIQYITNVTDAQWKDLTDVIASKKRTSHGINPIDDQAYFRVESRGRVPGN